jgi:anthranilate/para-aminobenzoate synthase component II
VHHFGGSIVRAPQIVHGKSSKVRITKPSPLLEDLPKVFDVMRYHSLIASVYEFPKQLEITGRETEHDLIMALQHKERPIYGVQFHPESIGTPYGAQILKNFVEKC